MKPIFCQGSLGLETHPEPEELDATVAYIFHNKELLHSLSGKEQTAVELHQEGVTADSEWLHNDNRNRIARLHNQYGHLAP